MRSLAVLAVVLFAAGLAWGNGDVIRYEPKTGVILPGGPTAARVERETLTIEFVAQEDHPEIIRRADVRAEYAIVNPTDRPLELDIGFPISGVDPRLVETPVMLDGRPLEWRLVGYDELIRPLMPSLVKALRAWEKGHPKAMELAAQMRSLQEQQLPRGERLKREESLWQQLREELLKAGVEAPSRSAPGALRPTVGQDYGPPEEAWPQDVWEIRGALRETGQRGLLPEGRWWVSETMVDPATGREIRPPYADSYSPAVSMLTFSIHLDANSTHTLAVRYRQAPSGNEEWSSETAYQFQYVLDTNGGWASFGPIDVTVTAPSGLVLRSLPKLRYVGPSKRQKVYQATLRDPGRNLQIALATRYMLLPRLKVNGRVQGGRYDMLVGGTPLAPAAALPGITRHMEQGVVVLGRNSVTVRVRPGEGQMVVNGSAVPLPTLVVVRDGRNYLPVEVVRALYPASDVMLSYDERSRTVLLGIKPKARADQAGTRATSPPARRSGTGAPR
jgi:hypothetical protein